MKKRFYELIFFLSLIGFIIGQLVDGQNEDMSPFNETEAQDLSTQLARSTLYIEGAKLIGGRLYEQVCFNELETSDAGQVIADEFQETVRGREVVNGEPLNSTRYPNVVSLQIPLGGGQFIHLCGGTLLTKSLVLTAAHCILNRREDFRDDNSLYTGLISPRKKLYITRAPQCRHLSGNEGRILAKKHFIHPDYNFFGADLVIIELERPFDYDGPFTQIAQSMSFSQLRQLRTYVVGWGLINQDEQQDSNLYARTSVQLRRGPLRLARNRQDCRNRIARSEVEFKNWLIEYINEQVVCAVSPTSSTGVDSCAADSGGPLFLTESTNYKETGDPSLDLQLGIVSWGPDSSCAGRASLPGIYTNLPLYASWIHTIVRMNTLPKPPCLGKLSLKSEVQGDTVLVGNWNYQQTLFSCCESCSGLEECNAWIYCIDNQGCQLANGSQVERGFCELRKYEEEVKLEEFSEVTVWSGYRIAQK